MNLSLKSKCDTLLQRIANVLLLNASFIDNLGLRNGKMGIAIFYYHYARYTGSKLFGDFAGELIDEIYEEINTNTPVDFANGLTGIGWGIEYLIKNRFIEADTDEALVEMDSAVYLSMFQNPILINSGNDLFGYGFYTMARLYGHENDDDNLNTLIKKERLIYLTDECERLLIHKRYLEFNILQLSIGTINSLLWFLIEMQRIGISPSKTRKLLHCILEYLVFSLGVEGDKADKYILCILAQNAAKSISEKELQNQYQSVSDSINIEFDNCEESSFINTLTLVNLQKLIYQPYIKDEHKPELFNNYFDIINNEENWNRELDNINKIKLGLTGLAGVGLFLLEGIKETGN